MIILYPSLFPRFNDLKALIFGEQFYTKLRFVDRFWFKDPLLDKVRNLLE